MGNLSCRCERLSLEFMVVVVNKVPTENRKKAGRSNRDREGNTRRERAQQSGTQLGAVQSISRQLLHIL